MRLASRPAAPRLARCLMFAVALYAVSSPSATSMATPASPAAAAAPEAITSLRPEVRLRKLHLVRPDLIQYPLSYDVYC